MIYHSNNPVVNNLRKMLLNLELELTTCESLIALNQEKANLLAGISRKKEKQAFLEAVVNVDNYKHYRNRIVALYNAVITRINNISARYEGKFDVIFSLYILQGKDFDYVCEKVKDKYTPKQVKKIVALLEKDLEEMKKKEML